MDKEYNRLVRVTNNEYTVSTTTKRWVRDSDNANRIVWAAKAVFASRQWALVFERDRDSLWLPLVQCSTGEKFRSVRVGWLNVALAFLWAPVDRESTRETWSDEANATVTVQLSTAGKKFAAFHDEKLSGLAGRYGIDSSKG